MGDTVRLRPNHYETLGLTPSASAREIAQAFAKQLTLLSVRPYGWLAQVSVAHETLRNPAKRKAYDAALFPKPPAAPPKPPAAPPARAASPHPVFAQLFRPASPEPVKQSSPDPFVAMPPPTRGHEWKPAPPAPIMFRGPQPAAGEIPPVPAAKPEELGRQTIIEEPGPEAIAPARPTPRRNPPEPAVPDSEASIDWKLPALAAGALILAIAGGAWAGLEVGNDNQQMQPDRVATLDVPPAQQAPAIEDPQPAAPVVAEAKPIPRTSARVAPVERTRPPLEIDLAEGQPVAQLDQPQPDAAATEPLVAEASGSAAPTAKLPLPDTVIARTIRRIGYGCGQVASTTAIDGEAGAFKVTCTSGQSYRAAPVRGRYHFRRISGR